MSKKPNLTSQDVRAKILQLRDSLVLNLEFIQEAVDRDLEFLQGYYKRYGDLNYRPVIGRDIDQRPNYGERTELMIEPVASKYRATIKSLLDSVRLIESEILPEDNPEGGTAASSTQASADASIKRTSLRAEFSAASGSSGKAIEPDNTGYEEELEETNATQQIPTKLVEKPKTTTKLTDKPKTELSKPVEPNTNPKPWRTKPQAVLVPSTNPIPEAPTIVDREPEKKREAVSLQNPNKLDEESERMRAELMALRGPSKMGGLMSKYAKRKPNMDDDSE